MRLRRCLVNRFPIDDLRVLTCGPVFDFWRRCESQVDFASQNCTGSTPYEVALIAEFSFYLFRRIEHIPPLVDDAIAIGAKVVWMQLGLKVVMDRCIKTEYARLFADPAC